MGTRYTGAGCYVSWAGVLVSTYFRSFEQEEEMGLWDNTAGPLGTAKTYSILWTDGKAHLEAMAVHGEITPLWDQVKPGTTGTLIWGEEGAFAGCPRHTVTAIVMNRHKLVPYDGVVTIEVEFQFSGPVTDSTF